MRKWKNQESLSDCLQISPILHFCTLNFVIFAISGLQSSTRNRFYRRVFRKVSNGPYEGISVK